MKRIVAILIGVFAVVVGLFAFAILLPPGESKDNSTDIDRPMIMYQGPNSPVNPPVPNAPLSPDRQLNVWNSEHAAFEIEWRFGRAFMAALRDGDGTKAATFFRPDFSAGNNVPGDWVERTVGSITEASREFTGGSEAGAAASGVVELLLAEFAPIGSYTASKLHVRNIVPTAKSEWRCRIQLFAQGKTVAGAPVALESEHTVDFVIEDEAKLATAASIKRWSLENESLYRGDKPLMEELTSMDMLCLRPMDNWRLRAHKNPAKNITPLPRHRFQMAVGDFDGDHDDDISIVNTRGDRIVLRNEKDKFVYATKSLKLNDRAPLEHSVLTTLWFDYDNDGYPDLLSGEGLFHNEAGKKLTDVTKESGLAFSLEPFGVSACDYDCDGKLDLYFVYHGGDPEGSWISDGEMGVSNRLWRNTGEGHFEDVTETANAGGGNRQSTGATWLFMNDDHYPDLLVANELNLSVLLVNQGDGTFKDSSELLDPARTTGFSGGATAGDIDNDGRTDVYLSSLYSRAGSRVVSAVPTDSYSEDYYPKIQDLCSGSRLYRQKGDSVLEDITAKRGVGEIGWAWGATMFDVNNDGWLDIYATSGLRSTHPMLPTVDSSMWRRLVTDPTRRTRQLPKIGPVDDEMKEIWSISTEVTATMRHNLASFERNRLFLNKAGSEFVDGSFASAVDLVSDSRSAVPTDLDGDGSVDLLVASVGGGSVRAFMNRMPQGNRVQLRLKGTVSNRAGIGSRVIAMIGDRQVVRDLFPSGFMSSGPSSVWIGMGEAETIDRLSVRWPTGKTQVFENVKANQVIEIQEDAAEIVSIRRFE